MDITEYINSFTNEIKASADAQAIGYEEAFLDKVTDELKESEVITDYVEGYFKNRGSYNRQVEFNGYGYEDADGTFSIFVVDDLDNYSDALTNTDIDKFLNRAEELVRSAISSKYEDWEESSVGYQAAFKINELYKNIAKENIDYDLKRIRIFILTNKILSNRFKNVKRETIENIPVEYSIYDATRLYDMAKAGFEKEPVDIVLSDFGVDGITAIRCESREGEYTSYLASIPGKLLSDIYLEFGTRILEGNVRSFLSVRGKVNKGIRQTILENPDKFFILNNGITVTSTGIDGEKVDEILRIKKINDIQIVNGGQTTASLASSQVKSNADLSKVNVMMKLSVIPDKDIAETLVPEISRASNSQNKVDEADFFSNHPFHIKLEDLSKKVLAPAVDGNQYQTSWFYERARGQYDVALMKLTGSETKAFKNKNPKNQVLKKTDIAKYFMTYEGYPQETSKGAQKVMREFSRLIQGTGGNDGIWAKDSSLINEKYFKDIVSKAILFKETERIVSNQDWYKEIKAYRANIVAYTIAILAWYAKENKKEINLNEIWKTQNLDDILKDQIIVTSREVYDDLLNWSGRETLNVTEWAKKKSCWDKAKTIPWHINETFGESLIDFVKQKKSDVNESTVDAMSFVTEKPVELWMEMKNWGKKYLYTTPIQEQMLELAIEIHTLGRIPTDKKFKEIVQVYNYLVSKGFKEN